MSVWVCSLHFARRGWAKNLILQLIEHTSVRISYARVFQYAYNDRECFNALAGRTNTYAKARVGKRSRQSNGFSQTHSLARELYLLQQGL